MSASSNDKHRLDLIEQMAAAAGDFYRFGWIMATSGNMSSRLDAQTVVISAAGRHKHRLKADDFVDVAVVGQGADNGDKGGRPSTDVGVHLKIYEHLDEVHTIYHLHHLEAALCSDRDKSRGFTHFHDLHMLHGFDVIDEDNPDLDIPILGKAPNADQLIEAVDQHLSDNAGPLAPCINVENHGIYVWGNSPQAARRHAEACAYLFEYSWQRPMNPKRSSSISGFQT